MSPMSQKRDMGHPEFVESFRPAPPANLVKPEADYFRIADFPSHAFIA